MKTIQLNPEDLKEIKAAKQLMKKVRAFSAYSEAGHIDLEVYPGTLSRVRIQDAIEHMLTETKYLPMTQAITVRVAFPDGSPDPNPASIKKAVNGEIVKMIYFEELEIKRLNIYCLILLGGGIFALLLSGFFRSISYVTYFFQEISLLVSWGFVWSSVETFFLNRRNVVLERQKLYRLYIAEYESAPDPLLKPKSQ
ncbi:MAG: hypothetical protein NTV44_00805 [Firmicutes bacterium]|nr:hypothetical protein [Bacillota bacterium]